MNSQVNTIKTHLIMHGKISSWEAITKYRITRLSALIYILRHEQGMRIESNRVINENKNWVDYIYIREEKDGQFQLGL